MPLTRNELERLVLSLDERVLQLEKAAGLAATVPVQPAPKPVKKTRRKKAPLVDLSTEDLDDVSPTELATLARERDLGEVWDQLHRETLIEMLRETREALEEEGVLQEIRDPLEDIRLRSNRWVQANRRALASQFSCDFDCLGCPHTTVVECYVDNGDKYDPNFPMRE